MTLLDQFLNEDATDMVRKLLLQRITLLNQSTERRVQDFFTFNRFNVRIDTEQKLVTLEDELDTSEAGRVEIPLAIFISALNR